MRSKRIDVAVYNICYSACANYIFLAGRYKFVSDGALLAWHGAPSGFLSPRDRLLDTNGLRALTLQLSKQFFSEVSVDERVALRPNANHPDFDRWRMSIVPNVPFGWTWSRHSLVTFGVENIVRYRYPVNPIDRERLSDLYGMNILYD